MADLFDQDIPYEAAEAQKFSLKEGTGIILRLSLIPWQVLYYVVCGFFIGLWRLFVPVKPKNIENQVVLITGGGNGIGKQLAREFAREKCKIAVVDIDYEAALTTADEIQSEFKVMARAFRTDISDVEQVEKLRIKVEDSLGCVDILVNNAGILTTNISLFEGSHADIKRIIDINMTSHFWTLRVFIKGMLKHRRGHIVAMSSALGRMTSPLTITYAATKHGVCGLMDSLMTELAFFELDFIKTTTVLPFFVKTRKDLVEKASTFAGNLPFIDAEYLAKVVVDGVRRNRREIYIPNYMKTLRLASLLPERAYLFVRNLPILSKKQKNIARDLRLKKMIKALDLDELNKNDLKINVDEETKKV